MYHVLFSFENVHKSLLYLQGDSVLFSSYSMQQVWGVEDSNCTKRSNYNSWCNKSFCVKF